MPIEITYTDERGNIRTVSALAILKTVEVAELGAKSPGRGLETIRREHANAYVAWTEADEERLATEFATGRTIDELATSFGRQPGAIRSRLFKLGLIEDWAAA